MASFDMLFDWLLDPNVPSSPAMSTSPHPQTRSLSMPGFDLFDTERLLASSRPYFENICDRKMVDLRDKFSLLAIYVGVELVVVIFLGILACLALATFIKDDYVCQEKGIKRRRRPASKDTNDALFLKEKELQERDRDSEDYYSDSFISYNDDDIDVKRLMEHYYVDEVTGDPVHHSGFPGDFSCNSSLNGSHSVVINEGSEETDRVDSYKETYKLRENCPDYLDTYLNNCYGILEDDDNLKYDGVILNELDDVNIQNLDVKDAVKKIERLRCEVALNFERGESIFQSVIANHESWCSVMKGREVDNRLRSIVFQLVSDLIRYQDVDEVLDSNIYFQFVDSMLIGVSCMDPDVVGSFFGICMRNLVYVVTEISIEDFCEVCFERWYRDGYLQNVKLEILKLVLVRSYREIVGDHDLFNDVSSRINLILSSARERDTSNRKIKELLMIWDLFRSEYRSENSIVRIPSPVKRKLSTSRNVSSGRSKRPRALRDLTNICCFP